MVDFAGWDMPVQYSSLVEEHKAVRNAVGLFDVSHMGEIEIRGPEAYNLIQYVSCNDAAKLQIGQAHYSALLYEHGGFVDDILVHKVDDDHYFLCVNSSNQEKDYDHISTANLMKANVEYASDRYAQIAVQGPKALATAQKLTRTDLAGIRYYWFADGEVSGIPSRIARTGYTGEDGVEIYMEPSEAPRIWDDLMNAGEEFGIKPCGLGARNTLRLEAKMALYGHEITASITPWEADLAWIVKLDKGTEFLGSKALEKQRAEGVKRKLVGLRDDGPRHRPRWIRSSYRWCALRLGDQRRAVADAQQKHRIVLFARGARSSRAGDRGSRAQPAGCGSNRSHSFLQTTENMSNYPENLHYTKEHEWVRVEGDTGTVGITWHAQHELGDIVYVDLPKVGAAVQQGGNVGSVESVKAVSDIYSPISGEIVETNDALSTEPEKLNQDPHGEAWLVKIRLSAPDELKSLLNAADYQTYVGSE